MFNYNTYNLGVRKMKITVFGAAGEVGSRIVAEALTRDHEVSAVVRDPAQFHKLPQGVKPCAGDAGIIEDVVRLTAGQDLVISAVRPPTGSEDMLVPITQSILNGVSQSEVRVLIVGGAASLKIPEQGETTVLTAPNFLPEEVINIARACFAQHQICNAEQNANWAYVSPPAMLIPGTRTGQYRLGSDELIFDKNGQSKISMEDFAVVLLDEAEHPKHHRSRFTAAY
jgi:putative NADH-flavin reductase